MLLENMYPSLQSHILSLGGGGGGGGEGGGGGSK